MSERDQSILNTYKAGHTLAECAKMFDCGDETVRRIIKKLDPHALRNRGRKPSSKYVETIRPEDWEELDSLTAQTPVAVTAAE